MTFARAKAVAIAVLGTAAVMGGAASPPDDGLTPRGRLEQQNKQAGHVLLREAQDRRDRGERLGQAVHADRLRSREVRERERAAAAARALLRARGRRP